MSVEYTRGRRDSKASFEFTSAEELEILSRDSMIEAERGETT
jgi:hypothetical protein